MDLKDLNKPAFTLTVGELIEVFKSELKLEPLKEIASQDKKHIKGIKGLAEFLGVSTTYAQKLKNSGKIPFSQYGRVILFDPEKVLAAMEQSNLPRKR